MRIGFKRGIISFLLMCPLILPSTVLSQTSPSTGYHDYESLSKELKQIASQYSGIVKMSSIGKSLKNRDLWMLQVTGNQGGSASDKQALLICGNLEGDHVIGSEVALGIARYLAENYGKQEDVTESLNQRVFYIIPRLNPDGAELFFDRILSDSPGNLKPRDDDYDWLVDEDGPEDLNGDGLITVMRVKDPEGDWYIDDKDPRLMKKKESDTPLDRLYKLYPEGTDNDGDERYNEDGLGGFNINRNFPHNYGYDPKGVGVYATSEVETQAVIDFLLAYVPELKSQPHRNVSGILIFSKYDNLAAGSGIEGGTPTFPQPPREEGAAAGGTRMFFRMGSRGGAQPDNTPPARDPQPKQTESGDVSLFKSVSEKYKEITGIKSAHSEKPFGSMLEWGYFQFGVPTFSANLWSLREAEAGRPEMKSPQDAGQADAPRAGMPNRMMMRPGAAGASRPGGSDSADQDGKWLNWIEKENEGQGFVAWTKYNHKQLGEVEIGGFRPYLRTNPAADQIPALSKSHAEFALYLAGQFADIQMADPVVTRLSSGLYELKIKVRNTGKFPYVTAMGQRTRNISPIMLRLKFQDDQTMELFGGSKRIDIPSLDAGAEKEYKWKIIAPAGKKIEIKLWARSGGGTTQKSVVLK